MTVRDRYLSNTKKARGENTEYFKKTEEWLVTCTPDEIKENPRPVSVVQHLNSDGIFDFQKITDLPVEKILIDSTPQREDDDFQEHLLDIIVEPLKSKESCHNTQIDKSFVVKQEKTRTKVCVSSQENSFPSEKNIPENSFDSINNRLLDIIFEPFPAQNENPLDKILPKNLEPRAYEKLAALTAEVHQGHLNSPNRCQFQLPEKKQRFLEIQSVACQANSHTQYSLSCTEGRNQEIMVEAKVIYASSKDPKFPPSAVLDGQTNSFWISCGLYPQQMLISLAGLTHVDRFSFSSYNVRRITLEKSVNSKPTEFQEITNQEAEQTEGKLQTISVTTDQISAAYLRLTILEGHDHFCSLHSIMIAGAEDCNGPFPPSINKRVHTNPVVSQITHASTQEACQLDPETEETDEDVDNASTYTQHGESTLLKEFLDDESSSLPSE